MTLHQLIEDLKTANVNENTIQMAINCYELGVANERAACAALCDESAAFYWGPKACATAIRARSNSVGSLS